jgi:hypothetical protein
MDNNRRPVLDMTPDGGFRAPTGPTLSTRIIGLAVLVAVVAGAVAFAAFALWIALLLVPVFLLAVLIAVGTLRFRIWQAQRRRGYGGRDIRPL